MSMAKSIGNQIRLRRSVLRISQEALGFSLTPPMKQQVISKIESGHKELSASQLFQLSHQMGVPVSYFFEGLSVIQPEVVKNNTRPANIPGMPRPEMASLKRHFIK